MIESYTSGAAKTAGLGEEAVISISRFLGRLEYHCEAIGLTYSVKYIQKRFMPEMKKGGITFGEVGQKIRELHDRISDEMQESLFLFVPKGNSQYFHKPQLFGPEVASAFPSVSFNVEEAGNCYALGRHTACVFHLQGVMQAGLNALGDAIGVLHAENRTWDAVLSKIDPELRKGYTDKSEYFKSNETFCAEAAALLRSVKIAWRNPTMHVETIYDEEKSFEVFNAVKGFMRHLATRLKERE